MNTFTIGLGVQGYLKGADKYLTGGLGDYLAIDCLATMHVAGTPSSVAPRRWTTSGTRR